MTESHSLGIMSSVFGRHDGDEQDKFVESTVHLGVVVV